MRHLHAAAQADVPDGGAHTGATIAHWLPRGRHDAPLESAATLPRRLALLFEQAHFFVIPQQRLARSYPRAIK